MRKIVLISATLALAACSSEPAEEAAPEPAVEETEAPAATVANGSAVGRYEVTSPDGTVFYNTTNADGTYSEVDADGNVMAEGSWAVTDGKTCFSPTTEGVEAMCYTESAPAEDGSFTATPDSGEAVTVRPAAAEATATEGAAAQ